MSVVFNIVRGTVAGLALAALAGCSGEPGPGEIKQAFRNSEQALRSLQASLELEARMHGSETPRTIEEAFAAITVEKGQCVAAPGAAGHVCDFRFVRTVDGQTTTGEWIKARFFQASGSWNLEQVQ